MSTQPNPLFPGKQFIGTVLQVLETKTAMSAEITRRYLQRAAMAGMIIGVLYVTNYAIIAAFASVDIGGGQTLQPVGRIAGALAFGWALVFIHYSKSELLTSNMMIVSIGVYYRRTVWKRGLRLLGLCYLGNVLGGFFMAALISFSTLPSGESLAQMEHSVATKLGYVAAGPAGWSDLFVRAVLCNFVLNLAILLVYNGLIKDDLTKSLVLITAVAIFAFVGFEHAVANTVLFLIQGLHEGINVGLALGNLGIALLGNFIGGGLLIGLYYAYVNDDASYLRRRPLPPQP